MKPKENIALFVVLLLFIIFILIPYLLGRLTYYQFGQLVGAFMVFGIMSFLLKENSFYRFLEHFMIGIASAIWLYRRWFDSLRPKWWEPVWDGLHGGTPLDLVWIIWLLLPVFALLWYFTYSRKLLWLNRIIIGFFMGVAAGYTIKKEFGKQIGQLKAMAAPLFSRDLYGFEIFTNIFMWVTVLIVMYYFFFTFRRKGKFQDRLSKLGRIFMMIGFGALFGNTIAGRLSWLIDRFIFLVDNVLKDVIRSIFGL